jgi:Matrixin
MILMDSPQPPLKQQQVMLIQTSQSPQVKAKYARTIGVCNLVENPPNAPPVPWTAGNIINPALAAKNYFWLVEGRDYGNLDAQEQPLESPKHGRLQPNNGGGYSYIPDTGYLGSDRATFLVEFGSKKLKMVHTIRVLEGVADNAYDDKRYCPNGRYWKISSVIDLPTPFVEFADLPGGSVGQATGTNITLDTNAAGHGWFVDTTPDNNDEFLATSNPNVWIARAGSAADGKMDMLSVLLHEYGHVLGLDHSGDTDDAMAVVLQPGVRKLWSETDLAKFN